VAILTIRSEQPQDIPAVRDINEVAFGQPTEAQIVDLLRAACPEAVSLVAVEAAHIVGHILFSPVRVSGPCGTTVWGMGLAPMGVAPERQRQGIGSRLVRAGLDLLRQRGCPFVVVLGHPEYYPRFGFVPAARCGISCQWAGVPDEVFRILVLDAAAMEGVSGIARYRDEFDQAL
jgi:putative acetyltransferase